ncbi:hypothetical protein ABZP36_029518 [Zizania latifolia]
MLDTMASKAGSQGESKVQAPAPSLYGRVLPSPPAVEFASPDGRRLFSEALQGGTMQGFFSLISCFQTQSEPAFCGLATLSVVLNALRIDPGRRWKGPWRWFDESMLDCCEHLDKVRSHGITFGKVACLAHCAGAEVRALRAGQVTVHDLRRYLVRCASSQDCHLIASYHRKLLGQVHAHLKEHRSSFIDQRSDNVPTLLSRLVKHLPPNAGSLIRWAIEVRRQEEGGSIVSKEVDERPFLREKVLQQIRGTKLFLVVHELQYAKQPCCSCSSSRDEDSLAQVAASGCSPGAALLNENLSIRDGFCFRETCSECVQANDEGIQTAITGKVVSEGNGQSVDRLSPISSLATCLCNSSLSNEFGEYPASTDILTVLFLSLHPSTWSGIEDKRLKAEFQSLVSADNLPGDLKREVLHLRRQLRYLKACNGKESCEDPLP